MEVRFTRKCPESSDGLIQFHRDFEYDEQHGGRGKEEGEGGEPDRGLGTERREGGEMEIGGMSVPLPPHSLRLSTNYWQSRVGLQ